MRVTMWMAGSTDVAKKEAEESKTKEGFPDQPNTYVKICDYDGMAMFKNDHKAINVNGVFEFGHDFNNYQAYCDGNAS